MLNQSVFPQHWRSWLAMAHDVLWVPVAVGIAFLLRFNFDEMPSNFLAAMQTMMTVTIPVQWAAFRYFRLYRGVWRYASVPDFVRIIKAVGSGVGISLLILFLWIRLEDIPRSILFLYPLVLAFGLVATRFSYRVYKDHGLNLQRLGAPRVVLLGCGAAGEMLLRDMIKSGTYAPVAILDDDSSKHRREIHGVRVLGGLGALADTLERLRPDLVMFAIPSAGVSIRQRVTQICQQYDVRLLVLPGLNQLVNGDVHVSSLREVSIEDLLGRGEVSPDVRLLERNIRGQSVMVTGAGGSIGSELCRQILRHAPKRLVLFEQNEFALYAIEKELVAHAHACEIIAILGSVVHEQRVQHVCRDFAVQTIYHAAAYKHVPLVEANPIEAIQNNVFGTYHTVQAAMRAGVETFVLISTDKAVRPTNVMGASKRFAELVLQALSDAQSDTRLCMVRFGNVLGSSGSVVPLFRQQIKAGGPVTVTHPEITRYFMTIPEASQLVLQAGAMGEGGDVFVLDMGKPVKIADLAKQMIQLSGMTVRDESHPDGDIAIRFSGLRPGEKLYEELLIGDDAEGTDHPLIMRAHEVKYSLEQVDAWLERLRVASYDFDVSAVRDVLLESVNGYAPASREL